MFSGLLTTVIDFEGHAYRNIHTVIPSEDLLDDLSVKPSDRAYGEALVLEQREDNEHEAVIDRPFQYGVAISPGKNSRGTASRFSDGSHFGVWYGSLSVATTVFETVYHWLRMMEDAGLPGKYKGPITTHRRVFKLTARGILIDLRGKETEYPDLISDRDYRFTHQLGDYLHSAGQKGLLVRSARDTEGINVAAFSSDILFDPRHSCYMEYELDGKRLAVTTDTEEPRRWAAFPEIRQLFLS